MQPFPQPASVHSAKRRWTVARLTPNNAAGSFRHEHPAWAMYTIAASTARLSRLGVPPPCRRGAGTAINGRATSQKSSGAQVRTMSATTSATDRKSCPRSAPHQLRHSVSPIHARGARDSTGTYMQPSPTDIDQQKRGLAHHPLWVVEPGRRDVHTNASALMLRDPNPGSAARRCAIRSNHLPSTADATGISKGRVPFPSMLTTALHRPDRLGRSGASRGRRDSGSRVLRGGW